jgi:hypothetical protein
MAFGNMLRTKLIDPLVDRIADQVVRAILDRSDRSPASLSGTQHTADPKIGVSKCEDQQVQPIPSHQNQLPRD